MSDLGRGSRASRYQVVLTERAERDVARLPKVMAGRVVDRLEWLAAHADDVVHHALTSLPEDLKGLSRLRVGDWRVLYWVYHDDRKISVYGVLHRSTAYRGLR